jgi:hypothetical protein
MALLLHKHGFDVLETGPALNTLSLRHLAHLLPLPAGLKARLLRAPAGSLGRLSVRLPLGNLYAIARRVGRG